MIEVYWSMLENATRTNLLLVHSMVSMFKMEDICVILVYLVFY